MIPRDHIQAWAAHAPWPDLRQVEQDLIICRVLCDLFNASALKGKMAFRGGTAINKLLFEKPLRYSEDIDLVQTEQAPIGETLDAIRESLAWLGKFNYDRAAHSVHLTFKFSPETAPDTILKVKIEMNTREHKNLLGLKSYQLVVDNDWYQSQAEITSYQAEEIFGTKLRALLQRQKNRDLFDLYEGLKHLKLDRNKLLACFTHYLALQELSITKAMAEQRMLEKLNKSLSEDIHPLLPAGTTYSDSEAVTAFNEVWFQLIQLMEGDPWKGTDDVIESLRASRIPNLLK